MIVADFSAHMYGRDHMCVSMHAQVHIHTKNMITLNTQFI